jgi:hypothetical protein
MKKQSQSNPIYSVFIRVHSWLISKQTQNAARIAYTTNPIFLPFNFLIFPYNSATEQIDTLWRACL